MQCMQVPMCVGIMCVTNAEHANSMFLSFSANEDSQINELAGGEVLSIDSGENLTYVCLAVV